MCKMLYISLILSFLSQLLAFNNSRTGLKLFLDNSKTINSSITLVVTFIPFIFKMSFGSA